MLTERVFRFMLELNKKQQLEYVQRVTGMAQAIGYTVILYMYHKFNCVCRTQIEVKSMNVTIIIYTVVLLWIELAAKCL